LLLSENQKLCEFAHGVAIERCIAREPETVQDRQQQRIVSTFSQSFRSLDE
jgi:hypothetical protein